ncbi:hypothetical protein VPH35_032932 [Triticum aestivum]
MAEEPSAKRHHAETSDKSSNLIDIHLHGKETLEIVCTSVPDKADEVMSRLRMNGGGLYPSFIGVDVEYTNQEEPPQMAAVLQLCVEELCLVYHITAATKWSDHKLWETSPLPDNLITYARIDAYAKYKSWKTIDNIVTGWDISKEQEADPYYHCNFTG